MMYRFFRVLFRIFFRTIFRLQVEGKHHIPKSGAVILCANHISYFDPPVVGTPLDRRVYFVAKEELFKIPIFGWLIRQFGAFPVKRGGVSKESIRLSMQLLREGKMLGIFPEGGRNRGAEAAKRGAASLALKTGAQVIPVAIIGPFRLFRKVKIKYGSPLDLSTFQGNASSQDLDQATQMIMQAIEALKQEKPM